MKLRDWPEFDLIRPAGANRLIVGFKTVRTIVLLLTWESSVVVECCFEKLHFTTLRILF